MNKSYNLKLDLQFRCNNSIMTFNEFDNNTSDFFIRITNGGKLVDIEKAIVVLATIKPSGKVSSQFVEVENGVVYANLKPSMKDEIGIYTARAMLILESEKVVTDIVSYEVEEDKIFSLLNDTVEASEEFTLLTDMLSRLSTVEISEEQRVINEAERILSEENRKIEEAKRVEAELVRQHEEADRTKYDATRESNENIRKQNESIRLANETNRIDEEAKRVEEENKRKLAEEERNANYNFMTEDEERRRSEANAHKEAEVLRVKAETNRVNEEAKRRTTEQTRVLAENTRVSNENTRKSNEIFRENNETQRIEAETQRQSRYNSFITDAEANASNFENYTNTAKVKEEERKSNELDRKSQEDRRVSNEAKRISNENSRKANEVVREKNEATRQNTFTNKVNEVDKKISEINITKDNFISSINTKVDNKISEIDKSKSDMTTTVSNKIDEVENRFNALTSKQQQDAEVIDARDGETSLKARLDRDIEKAKQVYVNVEGNYISTDSSSGYLKDVEILGNTIQNEEDLADIRSVGDKVEGQELYEIPVLSRGKNLINKKTLKEMLHTYIQDEDGSKIKLNYVSMTFNRFEVPLSLVGNYTISYQCKETVGGKNPKLGFRYSDGSASYNTSFVATSNYSTYNHFSNGKDVVGLCITYNNTGGDFWVDLDSIQLEEGTVATPYEPYQEDKITILSPTPLEKVGDVRDRIIEKNGVWGVEKNVADIKPSFKVYGNHLGFNIYQYTLSDIVDTSITNKTHFISNNRVVTYNDRFNDMQDGDIYIASSKIVYILSNLDSTNFEEKYNGKVLVKYPTTQPQFIPLPHDQQVKLRTFANKTNISFLTEIEGTIKAQVPKSLGATVNTHTEQINNLNKELDRVKKLEESTVSTVETESDFTTVEATSNGYFEDVKLEGKTLVVNSSNEVVESGTDGAMLKSVGDGADEIVVSSNNNQSEQIETTDDNNTTTTIDNPDYQSDKKRLLYYNNETQTWEKPMLREWDSIEKHTNGKYYYHQRSAEVVLNGSESWAMSGSNFGEFACFYLSFNLKINGKSVLSDKFASLEPMQTEANSVIGEGISTHHTTPSFRVIVSKSKLSSQDVQGFKQWLQTNNVTVVYQLAEEKVYECTNIDLITYTNETNYIVECGAISPKTTLKVHNNISNVVSLLQKKVSLLESNMTKYMITQNRMQLASTYSADSVTFKVDYALCSEETEEYNEDLYNLILNNILVGKDNYNYDKMFTMILDYASWNQISWEQFDILVGLMDIQHNPPIEEIPTDDEIVEEIPNEIM